MAFDHFYVRATEEARARERATNEYRNYWAQMWGIYVLTTTAMNNTYASSVRV